MYTPPLVITAHGICTPAKWQKSIADALWPIRTKAYDYGYYGLHRFLSRRSNDRMVDRFYEFYSHVVREHADTIDLSNFKKRPSIIAHSFGTYIVANAMLKFDKIKFDKVIFCGSILPRDFDLSTLFRRDQVGLLRNDFGIKDFWCRAVGTFVPQTGSSGRDGFNFRSKRLQQKKFPYHKHSDYFLGNHPTDVWAPFLKKAPFSLVVLHGKDVPSMKAHEKISDETHFLIDEPCFSHLPGWDEQNIPRGLALTWIEIEPDIYTYLKDRTDRSMVGYVNAMPLSEEAFQAVCNGELVDNEITKSHIVAYESKEEHKIYLMSMAIKPAYRDSDLGLISRAFETLLNGFIDKLIFYAEEHRARIKEIVAVGWTAEGMKLCEALGMENSGGKDRYGNPIFRLDVATMVTGDKPGAHSLKDLLRIYKRFLEP